MARKPISKKRRFEIFKRDAFTCQYCGARGPEVTLHVDHINPVASGGGNEIWNLTTSCADCNHGKRDRPLDAPHRVRQVGRAVALAFEARALGVSRAEIEAIPENYDGVTEMLNGYLGLVACELFEIESAAYAEPGLSRGAW